MKGFQTGRASRLSPPDKLEENAPSPWHQTKFWTKQNFHQRREATTNRAVHSWSGSSNNTRPVQCPVASIPRKLGRGGGPGRPHAAFFHSSENVTYDDASPATGVCQERGLQPDLVASSWVRAPPAATEEGPPRRPAGWQAWPGRLAPWPAIPMTSLISRLAYRLRLSTMVEWC